MDMQHNPVLLNECIDALNIKPDGIYVDGTLGRAGHSGEIVRRLEKGKLIAIDRDEVAICAAQKKLSEFEDKVTLVHSDFRDIRRVLDDLNVESIDGILLDLGVSSPQLDDASRGFSYMADAPLDMRMDRSSKLSAYDIVNGYDESSIRRILFEYGEERYSPRIASEICKAREIKPIETTFELVDIIRKAMPAAALREKQHPAKRSFQAIRIAVNDELGALSDVISDAVDRLSPNGRIAIITFHSLEDRIVKKAFNEMANPCICPPSFPVCTCGRKPKLTPVSRKPIVPTDEEIETNPRARSAKLRAAERI